jgi:hypothetical protein
MTEREQARLAGKRDRYLVAVSRAAKARAAADVAFRDAVLAAHGNGQQSLRQIGEAAGLSHVRILQIVKTATDEEALRHYGGDDDG